MRAFMLRASWPLLLVAALTATARAATPGPGSEPSDTPPPSRSSDANALCTHQKMVLEDPKPANAAKPLKPLLPALREGALEVRRALCIRGGTREEILDAFSVFLANAIGGGEKKGWFAPFGEFDKGDPLIQIRTLLQSGEPIPTIALTRNDNELVVRGTIYKVVNVEACDKASGDRVCADALDEFMWYYNYAQNTFSSEGARAFARAASGLSAQWKAYLDASRSFTPLELLINSALFQGDKKKQFSGPPSMQLIVLHPSIVVENVRSAVSGDKAKEALMVEALGANWWVQDKWYLPTGGSIIGVYADRSGVKGFGYGVAVHFRSVYSAGWTRHDDRDGVFVSFDLLKLLQDKAKVLQKYKP